MIERLLRLLLISERDNGEKLETAVTGRLRGELRLQRSKPEYFTVDVLKRLMERTAERVTL